MSSCENVVDVSFKKTYISMGFCSKILLMIKFHGFLKSLFFLEIQNLGLLRLNLESTSIK